VRDHEIHGPTGVREADRGPRRSGKWRQAALHGTVVEEAVLAAESELERLVSGRDRGDVDRDDLPDPQTRERAASRARSEQHIASRGIAPAPA
jgi:hypothetical protein